MGAFLISFAAAGNLNNFEINDDDAFEPVTSHTATPCCLNVSEKELKAVPLPEAYRLTVWDSVYNDACVARC